MNYKKSNGKTTPWWYIWYLKLIYILIKIVFCDLITFQKKSCLVSFSHFIRSIPLIFYNLSMYLPNISLCTIVLFWWFPIKQYLSFTRHNHKSWPSHHSWPKSPHSLNQKQRANEWKRGPILSSLENNIKGLECPNKMGVT